MRKPPYSPTLNLAILLWGLRVGLYALVVTTAFSFLCGIVITVSGNAGWVNLGEGQPWVYIGTTWYGFLAGIIVGIVVAALACLECMRRDLPE
jgi:hypothetical protein